MSRVIPWLLGSLLLLPAVACTAEEDLGSRSAADAGTEPGTGTDRAPDGGQSSNRDAAPDAEGPSSDLFGKTAAGESCDPASFPAASTSCSIPGSYTITESDCVGGACGAEPSEFQYLAAVTVNGTEVKITNGVDRLMTCELSSECDCVSSGGLLFRFTSTGYISVGVSSCPGDQDATQYYLEKGVRN